MRPVVHIITAAALLLSACGFPDINLTPLEPGNTYGPEARPADIPAPSPTPSEVPPPLVLMHGMAGFEEIAGMEYFYNVADTLTTEGYQVFTTVTDPIAPVPQRALKVAEQLDVILAQTGAAQVHLIAHSQGGLDARYIVSSLGYADRVASVTTLSTPHRGVNAVDLALGYTPSIATGLVAQATDALVEITTGTEADLEAQLGGVSERYVLEVFNPENPDHPAVEYYSYAGVTHAFSLDPDDDIVTPPFLSMHLLLLTIAGANDGLIPVDSAMWGTFLGTMPADHLDEVGMFYGITSEAYDHLEFFLGLAGFLYSEGPPPGY